jgi:hypothetical protein
MRKGRFSEMAKNNYGKIINLASIGGKGFRVARIPGTTSPTSRRFWPRKNHGISPANR